MIFKKETICGFHNELETCCSSCMTKEDWNSLKSNGIITDDDINDDENIYFCDRCNKQIEAL